MPPYASWSTAATNIQDAVDAAAVGDTVWVTNGIYNVGGVAGYPSGSMLTNRVAIYKPIAVRAVSTNPADTIIMGGGLLGDLAVRGVYMSAGTCLIGFTVTNCTTRTMGDYLRECSGAGVWAEGNDVTLSNCTVAGNSAHGQAGGVYGARLYDCDLTGNTSGGDGGGAYRSELVNSKLVGNVANGEGGGALQSALSNCIVSGNIAAEEGGGVGECSLDGCTLSGNASAQNGGGAQRSSLWNCAVHANSAAQEGGGADSSWLYGCVVSSNAAAYGGGASGFGDYTLARCVVLRNRADMGGGAAWVTLRGCALVGNEAVFGGGAYGCVASGSTFVGNRASNGGGVIDGALDNSVVYGNTASNGANHLASVFDHSDTFPCPGGTGNITNVPLFVDPGSDYGTNHVAGDYRLRPESTCINAGTNQPWMADASDLDGVPRIVGPAVDMGAYEYPLTPSGIPGVWLRQYGLPTDSTADLVDSDGDGMANRSEYEADTIPTDADSFLRFLAIGVQLGGTRLDWAGGRDAWQFLEIRNDLSSTGETWTAIYGIPPPTPLTNVVIDLGATNRTHFYRIRAQR